MADEMTRQEFAEYMTAFEQRLEGRFGGLDRRLDGIDGRLDRHDRRFDVLDGLVASVADLKQSMTIQFDETRREFRFSLEAIDALRETTNSRFDRMSREQAEHKADLERAIRYVRTRTERIEEQAKPHDGR